MTESGVWTLLNRVRIDDFTQEIIEIKESKTDKGTLYKVICRDKESVIREIDFIEEKIINVK